MARMQGVDALSKRLRATVEAAKGSLDKALMKGADEVADLQRKLAPVGDTGELRQSIEVLAPETTDRGARRITIVANADHALHVEGGTADTPAQPFFRPGFRLGKAKAQRRIKREIGKAVKAAFSGKTTEADK